MLHRQLLGCLKIGKQTRHGSPKNSRQSEEFFWKVARSFLPPSVYAVPHKMLSEDFPSLIKRGPQKKWEILDFETILVITNGNQA